MTFQFLHSLKLNIDILILKDILNIQENCKEVDLLHLHIF